MTEGRLAPEEVRTRTFTRVVRGYKRREVRRLLERAATDLARLRDGLVTSGPDDELPLTPEEVEEARFQPALGGYEMDEVDQFLDQLVAELERAAHAPLRPPSLPAPARPPAHGFRPPEPARDAEEAPVARATGPVAGSAAEPVVGRATGPVAGSAAEPVVGRAVGPVSEPEVDPGTGPPPGQGAGEEPLSDTRRAPAAGPLPASPPRSGAGPLPAAQPPPAPRAEPHPPAEPPPPASRVEPRPPAEPPSPTPRVEPYPPAEPPLAPQRPAPADPDEGFFPPPSVPPSSAPAPPPPPPPPAQRPPTLSPSRPLTPSEVETRSFDRGAPGYLPTHVDLFLARAARALAGRDGETLTRWDVLRQRFPLGPRGYATSEVDAFLVRLAAQFPDPDPAAQDEILRKLQLRADGP